jgi:TolB-like protein/Tfp pilus assembly protein PilF
VVSREELRKDLWPEDTFVDFEHGLNSAVWRLREALNDSADEPKFIETLPRLGYRYLGPPKICPEQHVASNPPDFGGPSVAPLIQSPGAPSVVTAGYHPLPEVAKPWFRFNRTRAIVVALAALVAVAFGMGNIIWKRFRLPVRPTTGKVMLAVLPFQNLSGDPGQDYVSDGFTEEMITLLGQIDSQRLGVIARTSAMTYKGTQKNAAQIGQELGADYILEGSVRREAGRLRVSAQLIQTSDQIHIWAQNYDRDFRDLLALESEVGEAIAKQVDSTLNPQEQIARKSPRPVNPAAYESYWKGEYFLDKMTPESVQKAADYFQDATTKDPAYVAAYDKLSAAYQMLGNMDALPKRESQSKAAFAMNKALALDPLFGPAHASKGWGALMNDLDFRTAQAEFKRAVELSPNAVQGHQGQADYYAAVGQTDQAMLEMERAREVDPLSFIVNFDVCRILYFARRFDEALAQCKVNVQLDPLPQRTLWRIRAIYEAKGMDAEAATVFLQASERSGAPPHVMATLKKAQQESGLRGLCTASLQFLKEDNENEDPNPFEAATAYTCAGNKEKALAALERALDERSFGIVWLGVDPTYDSLRSDPRFQGLLRRMGLPQNQ